MKIYVVTSGDYSDYGINAIFSTLEGAEEYIKIATKFKWGSSYCNTFDIEEWEMDKNVKPIYVIARYYIENGYIEFDEDDYDKDVEFPIIDEYCQYYRVRYCENEEVMKKAVYDQRAMYLAKKENI